MKLLATGLISSVVGAVYHAFSDYVMSYELDLSPAHLWRAVSGGMLAGLVAFAALETERRWPRAQERSK